MGLLDRLSSLTPVRAVVNMLSGRVRLKDSVDMRRAAVLMEGYAWFQKQTGQGSGAPVPTEDEVVSFFQKAEDMSDGQRRVWVHEQVTEQVIAMFKCLDEYSAQLTQHTAGSSGAMTRSQVGGQHDWAPTLLMEQYGFALHIKESSIPSAGKGVFLQCPPGHTVFPGTVLGFFAGKVHLREHLQSMEVCASLFPDDNFMLMALADGSVVDGRTAHEVPSNPFALAHMVNHPAEGGEPNVLQVSYGFEHDPLGLTEFPKELRHHVPNVYAKPPTLLGTPDRFAFMHTVVLLATKPLVHGDELFLDYRLNPDSPDLPTWYVSYDAEAARKRLTDTDE